MLQRHGDDVRITIRWFRQAFTNLADDQGTVVFDAVCRLRRFAAQVKNLVHKEIDEGTLQSRTASTYQKLSAALRGTT